MRISLVPLDGGAPLIVTLPMTLMGRKAECDFRVEGDDIPDLCCVLAQADDLLLLRDLDTDEEMIFTLVFPGNASIEDDRISVVAPIGTAMLGHRVGDEFEWEVPAGSVRLRVEEVLYQPEAAGDFHL